jgi:hypothetical protein
MDRHPATHPDPRTHADKVIRVCKKERQWLILMYYLSLCQKQKEKKNTGVLVTDVRPRNGTQDSSNKRGLLSIEACSSH